MKLNPDCVRAILFTVEKKCDFSTCWEYEKRNLESDFLTNFSHEEIIYHIRQCDKSGLISGVHYYDGGETIIIMDLSPTGHQFLANIRQDTNWNKTKEIAKNIGSDSLDTLKQIAASVISALIQSQLGC